MQGKGRRILLNGVSIMLILAMVILGPTGSQAQTEITSTDAVTATARRRPPISVPEPSTSILLLLGIGLTGLAGYSLKRLKHRE